MHTSGARDGLDGPRPESGPRGFRRSPGGDMTRFFRRLSAAADKGKLWFGIAAA